ncbi:unnamed protein product [Brassicogethes aeneus]|uniref:Uncharacterized protein n=1 Tax=Brassicogethes aeneus TaxID=1431903 RepID=A0A9P0AYC5_BRAAE|nr:unnamed protein product [Brassicogethes aeneus]
MCLWKIIQDRYGVSDKAGAAIASAVLEDYRIINIDDNQNIIDRYKVRRARDNERKKLQKVQTESHSLRGLYFDGHKDITLSILDNRTQPVVEEHVVLIDEPG